MGVKMIGTMSTVGYKLTVYQSLNGTFSVLVSAGGTEHIEPCKTEDILELYDELLEKTLREKYVTRSDVDSNLRPVKSGDIIKHQGVEYRVGFYSLPEVGLGYTVLQPTKGAASKRGIVLFGQAAYVKNGEFCMLETDIFKLLKGA